LTTSIEENLIKKCNQLRKNILENCYKYNNSHLSSCLSCADIIGVLYFGGFDKNNDIVLSKGHSCMTQATAMEMCGYKNVIFSDHPEKDENYITTTGSLGIGIGVAVGIALANQLDNNNRWTYCIIGDGECCEGLTQEALNLIRSDMVSLPITILIDNNGYSAERRAYNRLLIDYHDREINGHSPIKLYNAINDKYRIVICKTIKGFGISSLYDRPLNHYTTPNDDNIEQFRNELNDYIRGLEC
jgi:transketolase